MVKEEAFMKLYRNLIILVAVLLALVGIVVAVKLASKSGTVVEDDKTITVSKYDSEQVSGFTIESTEGKFVFKKNGTEWEMTSGGSFPIDNTNVNAVIVNTSDLTAYKLIEEDASSMEKYGLENPYRVAVKMSDGTEHVLEVGSLTPTKQAYYVKTGDSNNVYAVYSSTGDLIVATKDELRNKHLFDVYSNNIIKFALDRNGKKVFSAEKSEQNGWQLLEPIKGNSDLIRLTTIFESFVRAVATTYVEENAQDLAKYGLDNPSYVVEAATTDNSIKLLVGKENEKDYTFYAKLDGSNEVFTVDSSALSFIDVKGIEVCEPLVYTPNIYDVSEVVVNIDSKTITSKIESDSAKPEEDKFSIDGLDVMSKGDKAEEAFRNYYRSMVGIIYTDIELLEQKPSGTPEITITYTLEKAPGKMVVEFIPKDDRSYYALKNGEYVGMVVKKSLFDEGDGLRKNYEKLMSIVK